MAADGLWGAVLRPSALWVLPVAFPLVMGLPLDAAIRAERRHGEREGHLTAVRRQLEPQLGDDLHILAADREVDRLAAATCGRAEAHLLEQIAQVDLLVAALTPEARFALG
jgi:hypothetical protein